MKKIILIIVLVLSIGVLFFYFITTPKVKKYRSPDGNYTLIVTTKRDVFGMTMPGGGGYGSSNAVVILLDRYNKEIANSNSNSDFDATIDNITVEWDMESNEVIYAIARSIDLKTGEFLY